MTEHRHITTENYESWFLLYIDNELSKEQQQHVKEFIFNNPHLATELAALQATLNKTDEKLYFKHKDRLYKNADELADEDLILFLDGEADITLCERIAQSDSTELRQRLSLLRKTYSITDASISYSNTQKLYRHERSVAMHPWLFRVAAAVIVAAVCIWLFSNTGFIHKDTDHTTLQIASVADTLIAPAVVDVDTEKNNTAIAKGPVVAADRNPSATRPQQAHKNMVDLTSSQMITAEEKTSVAAVISEPPQAQLHAGIVKTVIEIDAEPAASTAFEDALQIEPTVVAASIQKPETKRNRFFKNVSEKIKETAIDVLSDDNENIIVAGLAINVRK